MSESVSDIVIVGGGLVGATLACALAGTKGGPSVTLIERYPIDLSGLAQYRRDFDARSTALTLSSVEAFQQIACWDRIALHAARIGHIHVSDRGRFGSTLMDASEENLSALGYVVENHWLGATLSEALQRCANLRILAPMQAVAVRYQPDRVTVTVEHQGQSQTIDAKLLVVADGAGSPLARSIGIDVARHEYGQSAVIANIGHQKAHDGVAYERFSDHGPMAMLPLIDADGSPRSALVWVREAAEADRLEALSTQLFLRELQRSFGYRLGRFERLGGRQQYPLALVRSAEQVRRRTVVLGNAAHSLHPVAGQGFNLSVRDAMALVASIKEARTRGMDIGSLEMLEPFYAERLRDQTRTILASDLLPKIFGSRSLPVVGGRGAGLVMLQLLTPARSGFVQYATGLGGR